MISIKDKSEVSTESPSSVAEKEVNTLSAFAYRLAQATQTRGTLVQLSRETGISDGLLSTYRKGRSEPSLTNAALIADALDVSLDWLAGRDPEKYSAFDRSQNQLIDMYTNMNDEVRDKVVSYANDLYQGISYKCDIPTSSNADISLLTM